MDAPAGLAFAADGLTVAAEGFKAAWLTGHWLGTEHRGCRLAAVTLALVNAGAAVQAAFSQALFSAHRLGFTTDPFFETGPGIASLLMLLCGLLMLSSLILRRAER
jgi:hypothetical protein